MAPGCEPRYAGRRGVELNETEGEVVKFGLLSPIDAPVLPLVLGRPLDAQVGEVVLLCDARTQTDRDRAIWAERMGQPYTDIRLDAHGLHDLPAKVPFCMVANPNDEAPLGLIDALGIGCLLNAGMSRKISEAFLGAGGVYVPPGVLLKYCGCIAVEWSIFNGDDVGNTAHFMNLGYDTGPINHAEGYPDLAGRPYTEMRREVTLRAAARSLRAITDGPVTPATARVQTEAEGQYWPPIPVDNMARVMGRESEA